jgi:hypothetical protein
MITQFGSLTKEEQEFLYTAPILVSILIAGADGDIDRNEIKEGMNQTRKQRAANPGIVELYEEVRVDFEDKLKILLQSYPVEATQRNGLLVEELSRLNTLLPKVEKNFAVQYYNSICDLAMKIAKSSGGLFGMKSIGDAEARYVKLPMIKDPSTY